MFCSRFCCSVWSVQLVLLSVNEWKQKMQLNGAVRWSGIMGKKHHWQWKSNASQAEPFKAKVTFKVSFLQQSVTYGDWVPHSSLTRSLKLYRQITQNWLKIHSHNTHYTCKARSEEMVHDRHERKVGTVHGFHNYTHTQRNQLYTRWHSSSF